MPFPIATVSDIPRSDLNVLAIVVVIATAFQDEKGFRIALMLVITYGTAGIQDGPGKDTPFSIHFIFPL